MTQTTEAVIRCIADDLGIDPATPIEEVGFDEAAALDEIGYDSDRAVGDLVVAVETSLRIHLADGVETRLATVHDLVEAAKAGRPYGQVP